MLAKHENKNQGINFSIGAVFALGFILIAFEWEYTDGYSSEVYVDKRVGDFVEEMIPITYPEKKALQIPIPPNSAVFDVLNVRDDVPDFLDDELVIIDFVSPEDVASNTPIMPGDVGEEPENMPVFVVEVMPSFPGGMEALMAFLSANLVYPEDAKRNDVSGVVYIQFVVSKTGDISDVKTIRGVHPDLNKEAERVVRNMPKWVPGSQQGRKVAVYYSIPIRFVLQ